MMVPQSAFFAVVLLVTAACGKGESTEPKSGTPEETEKGQGGAQTPARIDGPADKPTAKAAPSALPQEDAAPSGWKAYKNVGYSIIAPPAPPKNTDFGDLAAGQELTITGQEFRFANCFGQVMRLHYTGADEFDIEKGLDGGIETMLKNIGATTTESSSKPNEGRVARQYRVKGSWKNTPIHGVGRGIASDDKTVVIVNSFWKATDTTCPELGEFFINSLSADEK